MLKQYRQSLPPSWLLERSIVAWIADDRALRQQLPLGYRVFSTYCKAFFLLRRSATHLTGGRHLLRWISVLYRKGLANGYATIRVGTYTICLDLTDPRFLLVVNELKSQTDTKLLATLLGEGDTFVDVGANQGAFSILASALVGSSGQVVAIEPQPRLAKAVERSLAASPVEKFIVHQAAAGSTNGETALITPLSYSGSAGLYREFSGAEGYREIIVPLRRFDELVDWQSFSEKVFVKLDIEGSELDFLEGAAEMIAALRPTLLMEVNPKALQAADTTMDALKRQLLKLGYRVYFELNDLTNALPLNDLALLHRNILLRGKKRSD